MSDSDSKRFYVYAHLRPTGEVFYIGKGTNKRAWSRSLRNRHWNFIVDKHGFKVTIVRDRLTEKDAFDLEARLIKYFRQFGDLVNVADGGGGVSGTHVNLGVPKSDKHKENLRKANLGKIQSLETVEKRKKTMKEKVLKGWINPAKKEEYKQKGQKNYHFIGFYITPNGTYESVEQAAKANDCSSKAIRVRCFGNRCIVKGKLYTYLPKDGWSFIPKAKT